MYASAEQAPTPTCGVCGRKLGIGFYYSCHVCGKSYCYAHAPVKCDHRVVAKASHPMQMKIRR